jgi:hypothetical protein
MSRCVRHLSAPPEPLHQWWPYLLPVGLRHGQSASVRRATHDATDACCAILCSHLGFSRLEIVRVMDILAIGRLVAHG